MLLSPPRIFHLLFYLLCVPHMACSFGSSPNHIPTYTLTQKPFAITVHAEGTLEAKVSQALMTPRTRDWRQIAIIYLAPEGKIVKKNDIVIKLDPQSFENDRLNALNSLEMAQSDAQKKEAELTAERLILEADMESAKAAAAISHLQLTKLEFIAPRLREITRLEMQRNELRVKKIRKRLAAIEGIQKEERAHVQIKIQQATRKLKQAEEALETLVIKAPTDGVVVHEYNRWRGKKPQEGDTMYPGELIAKLPDLSVMQVKLQVGEILAQKLKKGQLAKINISSLENANVTGKITSIAKRAQPIKKNSKVKQVEVIVELDTTRSDFTPGLSTQVHIVVDKQPEGLVAPLECIFQQDSLQVVYVQTGNRFEPRPVTLETQNANYAVIKGNIKAGALLALHAPKTDP